MSELNNKIEELRTLKKSYSDLADKFVEINSINELAADSTQGKIKIANAISQKGIQSTSADSYSDMAAKIKQIKQTNYTGTSRLDTFLRYCISNFNFALRTISS